MPCFLTRTLRHVAQTELDLTAVCWDNSKLPKRKKNLKSSKLIFMILGNTDAEWHRQNFKNRPFFSDPREDSEKENC